jgi:hypothetical protein
MLKMDRYHFFIIMCQHRAHYKACKMDFGPRFFLAIFRSTQPCQDPIDIFNVATMGLNKLWMPSSRHKCCFFMEKLFTIMVWSKDNNPQNDNPIINVFGNLHKDLGSSLKQTFHYLHPTTIRQ